ncbi:MAG: hypothetical protein ABL971_16745 [Vicinamibacterales bacterium]
MPLIGGFAGDPMRPERRSLESQIEAGIIAGIASAIPTAILLAIGGAMSPYGATVPFYSIISIVDPGPLKFALDAVADGETPEFFQLQFSGGLGLCFVMGAISGLIFAFGTRRVPIIGWQRYALGALHGVAMMCLFYLVAFRAVIAIGGIEDAQVMSLARSVGWPILVAAHALHGVVIAWVLRSRIAAPLPVFGPAITADGTLRD